MASKVLTCWSVQAWLALKQAGWQACATSWAILGLLLCQPRGNSLTLGNIAAVPKDLLGSGSPQIAMHIRAAQYYCRLPKNGARIWKERWVLDPHPTCFQFPPPSYYEWRKCVLHVCKTTGLPQGTCIRSRPHCSPLGGTSVGRPKLGLFCLAVEKSSKSPRTAPILW